MSTITPAQFAEMQARVAPKLPPENRTLCAVDRESSLHASIIAESKKRGWLAFHGSMVHRAMRTIGEPDFTILADKGRVFFIEAKSKAGKLRPEQIGLANDCRRS